MSEVGKTPKPTVATPKVTTPQGSTPGSDDKPAQAATKEGKGKAVEPDPEENKDDDGDVPMGGVPKFQVENTVSLSKSAKVATPPKFKGDPSKLKEFIAKLRIYISHNHESFDDEDSKVLFAISYLEGPAFEFMQVYLDDYNQSATYSKMREDTRRMFQNIKEFEKIMKEVYGEPYEEEKATQQLLRLRMKNSYPEYLASFLQYAPRVKWEDQALRARFYDGLTDEMKDKLMDHAKPETFLELKDLVMRIWNRIRERRMEKNHHHIYPDQKNLYSAQSNRGNRNSGRGGRWNRASGRGGYNKERNNPPRNDNKDFHNKNEKSPRREGNCHNCGKPGHWARECRSPKKDVRSMGKDQPRPKHDKEKQPEKRDKTIAQLTEIRTLAMMRRSSTSQYWNELPYSSEEQDNDSLYESAEEYNDRTRTTIQNTRAGIIGNRRRVRIQAMTVARGLLDREVEGLGTPPPLYEPREEPEPAHGTFYSGEGESWAPPGYPEEWTRQEEVRQIEKEFPCLGETQVWYRCFRDWCEVHKAVKEETNYWPRPWDADPTCELWNPNNQWEPKWMDCTNQRCYLHFQEKFDKEYFPSPGIQQDREDRVNPDNWENKDNLYYPLSKEEQQDVRTNHEEPWMRWQDCEYGSCMFHVSKKLKYGVMGNPYQFTLPVEWVQRTKQFKDWDKWNKAIILCNIWGENPRMPSEYKERPTICDSMDRTSCTAHECLEHFEWKKWTGYFPDKWTIREPQYGWDERFKNDPSNLNYISEDPNFFRKYTDGPLHSGMHWTNCIIGNCEKHRTQKIKHSYVPTWRHWISRAEEDSYTDLKDPTLRPRGC